MSNCKWCGVCRYADPNRTRTLPDILNNVNQIRCKRWSQWTGYFDTCEEFKHKELSLRSLGRYEELRQLLDEQALPGYK